METKEQLRSALFPTYERCEDKVIIFEAAYSDRNMYYFVINGYVLEEQIIEGFCYFCEFISSKAQKLSGEQHYHKLCDECVIEWNLRKNDVKRINDKFYKINDSYIIPTMKHDAMLFDSDTIQYSYTVFSRYIIPISIFSYLFLIKFSSFDDHNDCHFHYYDKFYNDHKDLENDLEYVCPQCIKFALQLFVDGHYRKYMLAKNILLSDVDQQIAHYFGEVIASEKVSQS